MTSFRKKPGPQQPALGHAAGFQGDHRSGAKPRLSRFGKEVAAPAKASAYSSPPTLVWPIQRTSSTPCAVARAWDARNTA